MTVAPELPGGLELVTWLVRRGVVVACGHTDADRAVARAAFARGAKAITHLHNAHRRWSPRDPGIAGVALVRDDVTVTLVADLVHLAPETVQATVLAARGRVAVVTDAIGAAGLGDGVYRLGEREVTVSEGEARTEEGALAGSISTMDRSVANLVSLGVALEDAIGTATSVPARLVGRPDLGTLAPGSAADVVILDDDLTVDRTLVGGTEVHAR
jgi:N-acetylglucosamine-6-phosphate deacetylase